MSCQLERPTSQPALIATDCALSSLLKCTFTATFTIARGRWATAWSAEEMLYRQFRRVDIPAHARTAHNGPLDMRDIYVTFVLLVVVVLCDWCECMYECAWYHNTFSVHLSLGNKGVLYCILGSPTSCSQFHLIIPLYLINLRNTAGNTDCCRMIMCLSKKVSWRSSSMHCQQWPDNSTTYSSKIDICLPLHYRGRQVSLPGRGISALTRTVGSVLALEVLWLKLMNISFGARQREDHSVQLCKINIV